MTTLGIDALSDAYEIPAEPSGGNRNRALIAGLIIIALFVTIAVLAPWIAPDKPNAQDLYSSLGTPGRAHWLGTDSLGRDELSRLLYAGRTDLLVAAVACLIPFVCGTIVGSIAGYAGHYADAVLMRIADAIQSFPIYVLLLVLVFAFGPGARSFILACALVSWVAYARLIRGEIVRTKGLNYVVAARGGGLPHWRILIWHILPNTIGRSVVYMMSDYILLILALASLSFLGVGIPPPTPEWGRMIAESDIYLRSQWWLVVAPGAMIVVLGIGLSLVGDAIDARLRDG